MRVVFMGTPDFAVPSLQALLKAGHQVLAVVTQPDKPKGRGHRLAFSPVKEAALQAGLPVLQPPKVKEPQFIAQLLSLAPEVIAVAAFGQILPTEILDLAPFGCINVHASLLPKYRGAAPIHWAVINGESKTGVTTMYMERGLDTGDMLLKGEIDIAPLETVGSVHDRLADLGAALLVKTIDGLAQKTIKRIPQDHTQSTYAPLLSREDELIRWQQQNTQIVNRIRGMNPWPGAYTTYKGKNTKFWLAEPIAGNSKEPPGTVVKVDKNKGFTVQTGHGQVLVREVQPQGGKKMEASAFARGYGLAPGDKLGE